jgi:hypothetical protein
LLGTSAVAGTVRSNLGEDASSTWRTRRQGLNLDIFNTSALAAYVEDYRSQHVLPPRIPAHRIKVGSSQPLVRSEGILAGNKIQIRQATCPATPTVCSQGTGGEGFACSGCSTCCPDSAGGFQCCQQGSQCCVDSNGIGSCCPTQGGMCGNNGCQLLP